ncbi:uncharacterized protein [Physcomitrium patens]|uniref:uncharacterized protein isoform X3 n=1 Tax=Physcomitrium patens TaxID=3218 RepID=UPI000D15F691|nr:uncharacterized protein LOC112290060 isoform X2 [Physcomitrium patens]|eukprot:XP_024391779.1 uncharacterized protein LOC112290060 isoform X2 [Physcomitrella patens]
MLATCQFSGDMSALYLPSWILSVHQEIDREYHVHEGGRQGSIVYSWRVDFPKGTRRWGDVAIVQNKAEFRHRGT